MRLSRMANGFASASIVEARPRPCVTGLDGLSASCRLGRPDSALAMPCWMGWHTHPMRSTHASPERRGTVRGSSPEEPDRDAEPELRIRLLGPMEVEWHEVPVRMASASAQALVALLALRGRLQVRETVAADLWPELGTRSSAALRQALWLVRAGLSAAGAQPDRIIDADEELVGFYSHRAVDVDAIRFERLLSGRPRHPEEAVHLYRGELMASHGQEIFARERERFADLYEDALASVARLRLEAGDPEGARDMALRLLSRDPLREESHATLMEVYGLIGSRSQVTRQYLRLRALLAKELNVSPLPETEVAYRVALFTTHARSTAAAAHRRSPMAGHTALAEETHWRGSVPRSSPGSAADEGVS
jgi:DNA-binding SARP family transcriptional activator